MIIARKTSKGYLYLLKNGNWTDRQAVAYRNAREFRTSKDADHFMKTRFMSEALLVKISKKEELTPLTMRNKIAIAKDLPLRTVKTLGKLIRKGVYDTTVEGSIKIVPLKN